jgi:hypothetical protein
MGIGAKPLMYRCLMMARPTFGRRATNGFERANLDRVLIGERFWSNVRTEKPTGRDEASELMVPASAHQAHRIMTAIRARAGRMACRLKDGRNNR